MAYAVITYNVEIWLVFRSNTLLRIQQQINRFPAAHFHPRHKANISMIICDCLLDLSFDLCCLIWAINQSSIVLHHELGTFLLFVADASFRDYFMRCFRRDTGQINENKERLAEKSRRIQTFLSVPFEVEKVQQDILLVFTFLQSFACVWHNRFLSSII